VVRVQGTSGREISDVDILITELTKEYDELKTRLNYALMKHMSR
jgi:hypothetical protein